MKELTETLLGLSKSQMDLETEIKTMEAESKAKRKDLDALISSIADIMDELDVDEFKFKDGTKVSIKAAYYPTIKSNDFYDWMDDNDQGALIKRKVETKYDKEQDKEIQVLLQSMTDLGLTYDVSKTIHAQTLKSWARKALEAGDDIPESVEIFVKKQSKITDKK